MTSFRVTEVQLSVADGAVRCGSCLHIFNAPTHWLDEIKQTPTVTNSNQNDLTVEKIDDPTDQGNTLTEEDAADDNKVFNDTSAQSALREPFDSDFDFLDELATPADIKRDTFSDDLAEESFSSEGPAEHDNIPTPETEHEIESTFEEGMLEEAMSGDGMFDDGLFEDDIFNENIGETELLDDVAPSLEKLEANESILSEELDQSALAYSFEDLESSDTAHESNHFQNPDEYVEEMVIDDEQWAEDLLNTTAIHRQESATLDELPDTTKEISSDAKLSPDLMEFLNEQQTPVDTDSPPDDEFIIRGEPMIAGDRIGHDKTSQLLSKIEPEPIELAVRTADNRWIQRAWVASIVLSLVAFAGQYMFFNFDMIARDKNTRPLLTWTCEIVGCSVPGLDDITLIRSSNLVIRSHPKIANALVVDAIITNRANFVQNFPSIELQFTDLDNNIIARRRFSPAEYIRGELAGSNAIPPKQPIYISLEIVDPGLRAVSYQLLLFPGSNT